MSAAPSRAPATEMALVLGIDTSTNWAGVGLYDHDVLIEQVWRAGRDHGRQLLPVISHALARANVDRRDLSAVAVAHGPGSFTGLRVGLAVARGLSFALNIPLYGFGSLDVLAAPFCQSGYTVIAVLGAGRGRFAAASFRHAARAETMNLDIDGLATMVAQAAPCRVVGELSGEDRGRLAIAGEDVVVISPAMSVRRPAVLCEMAWSRLVTGVAPTPTESDPIYLARA